MEIQFVGAFIRNRKRNKQDDKDTMNRSSVTLPMGDSGKDKMRKSFAAQNARRKGMPDQGKMVFNPRILLLAACLWPLALLALFASSAPGKVASPSGAEVSPEATQNKHFELDRFEMRKILDRVDVMGYGPTHPRVAFVVVGETKEELIKSVESIFINTDHNRIFVVCAVLDDGKEEDHDLVRKLRQIEKGSTHWRGLKHDVPLENGPTQASEMVEDEDTHSPKIHVMFHSTKKGLAASRSDAADFVQILVRTHEDAGFKSPDEDIILTLMQGGTKFADPQWLQEVTPALIVAPPLLGLHNNQVAMKLANAISFHTEGPGNRTSFDTWLSPIVTEAPPTDLNLSGGKTFRTPALNGAAFAMRLGTFLNLPETDHSLAMDPWSANLDLSLNLWLCADGIDIIEDVEVIPPIDGIYPDTSMDIDQVAKISAMWMDDLFRERFYQAYSSAVSSEVNPNDDDAKEITRIDWETAVTKSRRLISSQPLYTRCRSFEWYIQEVNNDLSEILELELKEDHRFDPAPGSTDEEEESEESSDDSDEENEEKAIIDEGADSEKEMEAHMAPPDITGKEKPSEPLRPTNLEIVQKPKMVDISFVDISNGHEEHPHMGALDADGNPGYVHDEKALRMNPPKLEFPELKEACAKRDNDWRMMHKRVVVETEYEQTKNESGEKRDKIFCLVYTIEKFHDRIPNILQTWGPKCDGFMVGSTKTDPSIGAVNIPHEGPEEYNNIWQKVRSMWSYIYDNYYEEYDWFHIGGDDLFLLVENLRYYLESEEIRTAANGGIFLPQGNETMQTPLLLGRRFAYQGDMDNIFDSGGSGYTMNKAALKVLVTEGFPNYFPHLKTFSEDTMVAKLFKKVDTILPYDTKDDAGGERYMPFNPGHHWSYRLPENPKDDWYATYSIDIKEGPEHCSPQSVAFHYIKGPMMKRLYALAYGLCPEELAN